MPASQNARWFILGGFALFVVCAVLDVVNNYTSGSYRFMFASAQVNLYLIVLSSLAAITAWWYLSALDVVVDSQRLLIMKALFFFGVHKCCSE